MRKITLLGTGNAGVTHCYNTCFTLSQGDEHILIDGGGGNGILSQLAKAKIDFLQIHHIIVSHAHTDHIFGVIWAIRMISTKIVSGSYIGDLHIYAHAELAEVITTMMRYTLPSKLCNLVGSRIILHIVVDKEELEILNCKTTFFDINSTKLKQFGFSMIFQNGKKFTFLGDEPYKEQERVYTEGADWVLHEAFCLYSERDKFNPYEKHHATVKEACETAELLKVKNLLLYHTEDKNIANRKELYSEEGQKYYTGNLFVPNDLETIDL